MTKFRFGGEIQKTLVRFAKSDAWDLRDSINLTDVMIQKAVKDGSGSLVNSLLGTRAKLVTADVEGKRRRNELLEKATVAKYLTTAVGIVVKRIRECPMTPDQQNALIDQIHNELEQLAPPENKKDQ